MGHVLMYTRENTTTGGDRPAWNEATSVSKARPLSHQLSETDKV